MREKRSARLDSPLGRKGKRGKERGGNEKKCRLTPYPPLLSCLALAPFLSFWEKRKGREIQRVYSTSKKKEKEDLSHSPSLKEKKKGSRVGLLLGG